MRSLKCLKDGPGYVGVALHWHDGDTSSIQENKGHPTHVRGEGSKTGSSNRWSLWQSSTPRLSAPASNTPADTASPMTLPTAPQGKLLHCHEDAGILTQDHLSPV